ncbi:hypothetical protein ABPG72_018847 [Tetrahymena utriculariae]
MKEESPFLKSAISLLTFFSAAHGILEMQYFIWNIQDGSSLKTLSRMYTSQNVPYENRCYYWLLQNFMMLSNFALLILFIGFIFMKNLKWLFTGIGISLFKLTLSIIWFTLISSSFIEQSLQNQVACDKILIQNEGYQTNSCIINDLFLLERKLALTISVIQLIICIITPSYIKLIKYQFQENEPLIFSESLMH